jgi:hypothetical protein
LDAVVRETSVHSTPLYVYTLLTHPTSSLSVHPAVPTLERQSSEDDVIPLHHPIVAKDGSLISEVHIKLARYD